MPGRKKRTSRVLTCIIILLCLVSGILVPQSSSFPVPLNQNTLPDIIIAGEEQTKALSQKQEAKNSRPSPAGNSEKEEPSKTDAKSDSISPEAKKGTWVPTGSDWCFLVDEKPLTGWFVDTDRHHYYFNKNGIMQTGWLTVNGDKYYLDEDGIMQTGTVTIQGRQYTFSDNGILKKNSRTVVSPTSAPVSRTEEPDSKKASPSSAAGASQLKEAKDGAKIALTFDDGPGMYTERLLDTLEKYQVPATFFLVGTNIESYPESVKRMKELGCEFGNHTYSHVDLTTLNPEEIQKQLDDMDKILLDTVGERTTLTRPPFGSVNETVRESADSPLILWSLDAASQDALDIPSILEAVYSQVENGDIIHLHDIHESSVAAAEIFIPALIEKGYQLVTVSELAAAENIKLKTGNTYKSMQN